MRIVVALLLAWVASLVPAGMLLLKAARIEGPSAGEAFLYPPLTCVMLVVALFGLPGAAIGIGAGKTCKPRFLFLKGFALAQVPLAVLYLGSLCFHHRFNGHEAGLLAPMALLEGIPGGIAAIVMGYTRPLSRKEPNGPA